MRLSFRKPPSGPVVHTDRRGSAGLVVALHGYGATETQFTTLLPLDLPIVTVTPRAPLEVEPGFGWWVPEPVEGADLIDLAPAAAVDAAVQRVVEEIAAAQSAHGHEPASTILFGYSQGAALALSVAARHPHLIAGVVTVAGFLLPAEHVNESPDPLRVRTMNGSFDGLTSTESHLSTVERFTAAGHHVDDFIDPVPHVVDEVQVGRTRTFVYETLRVGSTDACE